MVDVLGEVVLTLTVDVLPGVGPVVVDAVGTAVLTLAVEV